MKQGQSDQSASPQRSAAPSGPIEARTPPYPGTEAAVGTVVTLADAYWDAAHRLLPQIEKGRNVSSAPARLCAIQSIETYLNAFLLFHSLDRKLVRGLQHDLAERTRLAVEKGLSLRRRTAEHLVRLSDQRDYLVVRYGPEQLGDLSEINRMFATLKEVAEKVRAAIFEQPYDRSDPRYKVYW
ncbi:hypothetical protein PX699_15855 [Sphingobium sp. H39-3-25]|uniref:hypothetical protein n=1 Tax=Sphingobium arseniciresistens TaxID=3030834 RepID=UPI0023B889DB|nr:hypothetical protein [Sphingobium arseniciresistens]